MGFIKLALFASTIALLMCSSGASPQAPLDKHRDTQQHPLKYWKQRFKRTTTAQALLYVKIEIEANNIDNARDWFLTLSNRNDLIENVIAEAYKGPKTKLANIVKFADSLKYFDLLAKSYSATFKEIKKHNHVSEKELLLLYYSIVKVTKDPSFSGLDTQLKNKYYELKNQIEPYKNSIIKALQLNIRDKAYPKMKMVHDLLGTNVLQNFFVVDVVQDFFSRRDASSDYPAFLSYSEQLPFYDVQCTMLEAIFDSLNRREQEESFEALQVWLLARFKLVQEEDRRGNTWFAKCEAVHDNFLKANNLETFVNQYVANLPKGRDTLKNWHRMYPTGMRQFLLDVVQDFLSAETIEDLTLDEFENLAKLIRELPFLEHTCAAVAEVQSVLKKRGLQKEFVAFRNTEIVKLILSYSNIDQVPAKYRKMCEDVKKEAPKVFRTLLWADTSNCKLINKYYEESLIGSSDSIVLKNDDKSRQVFTWSPKNDVLDAYWKISIDAEGKATFYNNYHKGWFLAHNSSKIFTKNWDSESKKSWGIEAVDSSSDYMRIFSYEDSKYWYSSSVDFQGTDRRFVNLAPFSSSIDQQWLLLCTPKI